MEAPQGNQRSGCPGREALAGFNAGLLPDPQIEEIAAHVSSCGPCEETLRGLDDGLFRQVIASRPDLERHWHSILNESGWARLRAKVEPLFDQSAATTPEVPREASSWLGRMVGNYDILEELGRGGMGVVFRARQRLIGREVALKMILAGPFASREHRERFRTEGTAASRLDHPAIVRVHDFAEYASLPYYTMELVRGETLADRLKRGPLSPRDAAELVVVLARAVDYAHQNKVLHRDLKPGNILLRRKSDGANKPEPATDGSGLPSAVGFRISDYEPKVADFGLAKLLDDEATGCTRPSELLGTPAYMAPEQANGRADEVGPATDVWALGVILHECLSGQRPFRGSDKMAIMEQVRRSPPPSLRRGWPGVAQELEDVCLRCLEKSPAARYPSAGALADDLERWLRGQRPDVSPPWWRRQLRKLRRTVRPRRASALMGLAVAASAVALYLGLPRTPARPADEVALEQLQDHLAAGKPVTLLDSTGEPRWSRWKTAENASRVSREPDGAFTVQSWSWALLELAPDPRHDCYRLEARIRHTRCDRPGEVGLYVGRQAFPGDASDIHLFAQVTYNDVHGPLNVVLPAIENPPRPQSAPRLYGMFYSDEARAPAISWEVPGVNGPRYLPAGENLGGWHHLEITVTPNQLTARWDGQPFSLSSASLNEEAADTLGVMRKRPKFLQNPLVQQIPPPRFDARGGLGLSVRRGAASFRDVILTPLSPPP